MSLLVLTAYLVGRGHGASAVHWADTAVEGHPLLKTAAAAGISSVKEGSTNRARAFEIATKREE